MPVFNLKIGASATPAGGGTPVLEVLVNGVVASSASVVSLTGAGIDEFAFTLDYADPLYPSSLSFRFNGGSGDLTDIVRIEHLQINGQRLGAASLTATLLSKGQTASLTSTALYGHLFGREEPNPIVDFPASTVTADGVATDVSGTHGQDVIYGSTNAERIRGLGDDDAINGGAGDDMIFGEGGNDIIIGGTGNDKLQGNDGDDLLYGQDHNDILSGGAGNDVLNGGTGDDSLTADAGNDILFGEDGNDTLIGTSGNNYMYGDAGNDRLLGGTHDDVMYGGTGNDQLFGAGGNDFLYGESEDDTLTGGLGDDELYGGAGNDFLDGGLGNDIIDGGTDTDRLSYATLTAGVTVSLAITAAQNTIGAGSDTITGIENLVGSRFNDTLTGNGSANNIDGGAGDDIIDGGTGAVADTLIGGTGTDTLSYASLAGSVAVTVSLPTNTVSGGGGADIISGFENITGSQYADTLTGDAGANVIAGGNGNDTIEGLGGDDLLDGQGGTDRVSYANALSAVTVSLLAGTATGGAGNDMLTGFENITGSAFNDTLIGNAVANNIIGGNGDDIIRGGGGNDTINAGAGSDTVDYSGAVTGVTVNLTAGTAANDGEGGADTLSNFENVLGSGFADTITGSSATGTLSGGAGNDTITSGSVNTLTAQINAILSANPGVIYDSTTGNFYRYVNTNVTWNGADTAAKAASINGVAGHIVQITSAYENSMIDSLIGTDETWLGGSDSAVNNTWIFSGGLLDGKQYWSGLAGGTAVNGFYTNWASGEPNNSPTGSDFMFQLNGGRWDDLKSTGKAKNSYIIEWEGVQLLTPASSTTIVGGDGLDTLYGAAGQDIFVFQTASAFNNIDVINNYNAAHHDNLNIADLLTGYTPGVSDVDLFARFSVSGANLSLQVDRDGAGGTYAFTSIATLNGLGTSNLNVEEMVAKGLLVMS